MLSPIKAPDNQYGTKLASAIGTAQKGSQPLICSLIFTFSKFPIAGVVGLASSVITLIVILAVSSELGEHHRNRAEPAKLARHPHPWKARSPATPAPHPESDIGMTDSAAKPPNITFRATPTITKPEE